MNTALDLADPAEWTERHASLRVIFKNVTREEVIHLFREWFKIYGEPPRVIDWDPGIASRQGKYEVAKRFLEEGAWPPASTVVSIFGSFSAGVIAAGFYPRSRTHAWLRMEEESRSDYLRAAVLALESLQRERKR